MSNDDSNSTRLRDLQGIKPPDPFSLGSDIMERWKIFKQRWYTYSVLSNLDGRPREIQVALFLHTLADDALKV